MAYQFTAASSQHMSVASAPVTNVPMTLACRANFSAAGSGNWVLMSVGQSGSPSHRAVLLRTSGTLNAQSVGTADVRATSPSILTTATDYHAAAVFESTTSRAIYINGAVEGSNAGTSTLNTLNDFLIGARRNNGTAGLFMDGTLAEVGIWNAALTDAEIASLAAGMTCDKVRPQSLVFYAPLVRDLVDVKGGLTITNNNGATVANHPRVYA
jgi:hypothetical protein